jgi:hypothetical protein
MTFEFKWRGEAVSLAGTGREIIPFPTECFPAFGDADVFNWLEVLRETTCQSFDQINISLYILHQCFGLIF